MPSPSDLAKFKKAVSPEPESTPSTSLSDTRTMDELIDSLEKKLKLDGKPVKRTTRPCTSKSRGGSANTDRGPQKVNTKKIDSSETSNQKADSGTSEQQKKPYVRKEHLTDRPFKDVPELQALRDSLPEATKYNLGKKPCNKENN